MPSMRRLGGGLRGLPLFLWGFWAKSFTYPIRIAIKIASPLLFKPNATAAAYQSDRLVRLALVFQSLFPPQNHLNQHLIAEGHAIRIAKAPAAAYAFHQAKAHKRLPASFKTGQITAEAQFIPTATSRKIDQIHAFVATQPHEKTIIERHAP